MASFAGCDAVINCAGPCTGSGAAVVRAAIEAGCHYVDTAGEQLYIKTIFDTLSYRPRAPVPRSFPPPTTGAYPET